MDRTSLWERNNTLRNLFQSEIFLTLPDWKRRCFILRVRPRKGEIFPGYVYKDLQKLSFPASCFLPVETMEKMEKMEKTGERTKEYERIDFLPDLTGIYGRKWKNISEIKKVFETREKRSCRGVFLPAFPDENERNILKKHAFLYSVSDKQTGSSNAEADPFCRKNCSINDSFDEAMAEHFCKSDPYGGIFGCFSLLLDENLTEKMWKEKILPLLERFREAGIACMSEEELREYEQALKNLRTSVDSSMAENVSSKNLYLIANGKPVMLAPGEKLFIRKKSPEKITHPNHPYSEEDWIFEVKSREKTVLAEREAAYFPDGTLFFPGGCRKALSFSYDDGNVKDKELIRVLNKYGMKGTFNLNSNGVLDAMKYFGEEWDIKNYDGHEVAGHGLYHHSFTAFAPSHVATCLYMDRLILESFTGEILCGHAYANGTYSGSVPYAKELLGANRYIYARGSASTMGFDLPEDFFVWEQTCHHNKGILALADKFLQESEMEDLKVFAVWGHVAELVKDNAFGMMDEFCCKLSGKEKYIWYATNKEICEYVLAVRSLLWAEDRSFVKNCSCITLLMADKGKLHLLAPGETFHFQK